MDLHIFEIVLSPSIAYPLFYTPVYILAGVAMLIIHGDFETAKFKRIAIYQIPPILSAFSIFYIVQRQELRRFY